ncbi:MAG: succinylglutamate desuccinylase [Lachnospiraceae bacterium]|nr:succinylglutamate desuccinylase [Lachnospiraceae bacterium]
MIEEVFSIELPVGERLVINKNRIEGKDPRNKRIAIVTGIHGDEFEGQYICYEMTRRIMEEPDKLSGTVDIYPALNPLGLDNADHKIPKLGLDLNRMFPGKKNGTAMERVAAAIVEDLSGADMCLDVHAGDIFVKEIPQVRVSEQFADRLLPYAKLLNADMVWMNATATVHESTLTYSMNMLGVPSMVVEMGVGTRIDRNYGSQIVEGIFHLMKELEMWEGSVGESRYPAISTDGEVDFIRSNTTGVFLPVIAHNHYVSKGDRLGEIVSPLEGKVLEEIVVKKSGLVFTLREYPFVREGSLLARILAGIGEK